MATVRKVLVKVLRPAFVLALVFATASAVDGATASWDPNPEPNIAGYRVSYGTQPGVHDTTVDVGKVTTFQFNPPPGQRYYLVVQAYNSDNLVSAKSEEATIDIPAVVALVNRAPTLVQPADQTSRQNAAISLALVASDPDGSAVAFSSTGLPSGLSLGATSGIISGVVSNTGSYPVTVTVSDGALSASRSFMWTVSAAEAPAQANRAPTLVQPADQSSKQNATVSLALVASDPDGNALTYFASRLPAGLSINATSGIISGVVSQTGSSLTTVTASDGALAASLSFTWTVTPAEAPVQQNRPPTMAQPPDQSHKRNDKVTLALAANHPDGKTLSYSSTGLPPGLALHSASGIISGAVSQEGTYRVSVTASDGALSVSRSFTWTVTQRGNKPNSVTAAAFVLSPVPAEETAPSDSSEMTVDPTHQQADAQFGIAGSFSGVTALQDGRLLLIENDRSLRMLAPGSSESRTVLGDSDPTKSFTEVVVNSGFPVSHHVFVGVVSRLDAETSEFAVVRYREVLGSLGEGAAVVGGLRFRGARVPRFAIDKDERVFVAMPATEQSDPYSATILRLNADGTVPEQNRVASPVFASGFGQPANLGWDGPVLVATGADQRWPFAAAQLNPEQPSSTWPQALEPILVGSSASITAAAFGVGTSDGMRAFIDSSGRLFRRSLTSLDRQGTFAEVPLSLGLAPVSVASGFDGQIYVLARSATGHNVLLELRSGQ